MIQKHVNLGPYIVGAAIVHSVILVAGMFLFVEFQKSQVAAAVENAKAQFQQRQIEQTRKANTFDEPADRRGQ